MSRWLGLTAFTLGVCLVTHGALHGLGAEAADAANLSADEMSRHKGMSVWYGVWVGDPCTFTNNGGDCVTGAECLYCEYNYPETYPVFGIGSGIKENYAFNTCGKEFAKGTCSGNGNPVTNCKGAVWSTFWCAQKLAQNQPGGTDPP